MIAVSETRPPMALLSPLRNRKGVSQMRAVLLWLLGIPIPIIILLWIFHVI